MTQSVVCATNTPSWRSRFTGKERDAESGNDYFFARYYASSMGRFMSPDPLNPVRSSRRVLQQILDDPQEWNKYSYGLNNPVRYQDSSGNFTSKDHSAMEMQALRESGYSERAASRAAVADVHMDNGFNMASGVPFLHHFVTTGDNPQHGEQEDGSSVAAAKEQSSTFMANKEIEAADLALTGHTGEALDALGQASHTAQDIVRHQYEPAGDHPLGEAPATDAETKAAVAATKEVEKGFETSLNAIGHNLGMSPAQVKGVLDKVKAGPQ